MAATNMNRKTRTSGPLLDPDIDFPPIQKFADSKKLPLYSDVIGTLRHLLEDQTTQVSYGKGFNEVMK